MKNLLLSFLISTSLTAAQVAPYGQWQSSISAEKVAEGSSYVINMLIDNDATYICELRPETGKYVIVRRDTSGKWQEITPPDFNVRTSVHEYGGGAFTVKNGVIYASNADDGNVYVIEPGKEPRRLTSGTRFADMHVIPAGLLAIGEHHGDEVENFLALIDLKNGEIKKLASGYDFYSSPAVSSDSKKIAWISWNHPNMPWTNTELWSAEIDDLGNLKNVQQIAGQIPESIFQPEWSPEGIIYFVTDRDRGWWNIHRYVDGVIENVCPMDAEVAEPLWTFQLSNYAFFEGKIAFTYNSDGKSHFGILDPQTRKWQKVGSASSEIHQVRSGSKFVQFLEKYPDRGETLIQIHSDLSVEILREESVDVDLSIPEHISYMSNGRPAYGFYYAPQNGEFKAPAGEKPPLIVMIHGGPTYQSSGAFKISHQFWTSRGYAILDVNYGGSTGYGKDFRSLLDGTCGVVDLEDCINGALFLAEQGKVDRNKLAIRGASSGGYTTLAALAFHDVFKAGASYFGISDLMALSRDTHKFEKLYGEQLYGKLPEKQHIWEERSPIHYVDQIKSPLILFQGEEDRIVPKNQAIMISDAMKKQGIPVDLHIYPGEGHGFEHADHIIDALEKEYDFYQRIFYE